MSAHRRLETAPPADLPGIRWVLGERILFARGLTGVTSNADGLRGGTVGAGGTILATAGDWGTGKSSLTQRVCAGRAAAAVTLGLAFKGIAATTIELTPDRDGSPASCLCRRLSAETGEHRNPRARAAEHGGAAPAW